MPGELFSWYVPLRAVLVFTQPAGNLFRRPLVVDFGDDERAPLRKKLFSPAQDFLLAALHVDLQPNLHLGKEVPSDPSFQLVETSSCAGPSLQNAFGCRLLK